MARRFDQDSTSAPYHGTVGSGLHKTRSLPIRGSVARILELWESRREEILDGIPAASWALRPGIDQGRWGTTFRLTLGFDAPPPNNDPGVLTSQALRRLKALVEAGVPAKTAKAAQAGKPGQSPRISWR